MEAPTLERFGQLMLAMGLRPVLEVEPLGSEIPRMDLAVAMEMTPAERLREASSWNRATSLLVAAGERARLEEHPATRTGTDG